MSSTTYRAFCCACLLLLNGASGRFAYAAQNQVDAKASASSSTGSLVISPQFESAAPFSEGLAAVQVGEDKGWKWGYIDKAGSFVIAPQFDYADGFSEGLAAVRIGDEKTGQWGFIDRSGNYAIRPNWDHATAFSRGLAVVRTGNAMMGKEQVIDKQGKYVSDLKSAVVLPCGNGMTLVGINVSWVERGVNRHFGFLDRSGNYAIKPAFDDAFCFTEGMAAVRVGDADTGKWGFIDSTGNFVIEPRWGFAYPFKDGIATVSLAGSARKWGAIDRTGQEIIALQYPEPFSFNDGLALVSNTSYQWGTDQGGGAKLIPDTHYSFVDTSGSCPVGSQWRSASSFSQGLAPVMVGDVPTGKWGYIDTRGHFIVNPRFDDARPFSEGMAAVLIRGHQADRWGYISR